MTVVYCALPMEIGVPRQRAEGERRVAITPDVAGKLTGAGHVVVVETEAGAAAGHPDDAYREAGAEIGDADAAWGAELVATVLRPEPEDTFTGQALIGLLQPQDHPEAMHRLAATGGTVFAFETVPRTTRAQVIDALSSQATASGYQAALEAAAACDRFFPMLTTAAGTIRPAQVLVIGAGVAGLQAIATARRLGAVVSAYDVRAAAAEQVESLGGRFVELDVAAQDERESGGYAREVADDEQARIINGLAPHVERADAVITTAAIPGRPAPLLITRDVVERMRSGSVIVDHSASTGGNCELTEPGTTIVHGGVRIVGDTDLVSRMAGHASHMLARNVANFIDLIVTEEGELAPNWDDDIVAESCIARDGEVVHPRVKEA